MLPVTAFLLALGAFGEVAAWVSGPIKGLQKHSRRWFVTCSF